MPWEMVHLKPHPHRQSEESLTVFIQKQVQRSEVKGVNAVQLRLRMVPLPLISKIQNNNQLISLEETTFRAIVDLDEKRVLFDVASADAALPAIVRGGGLGSLALSELVRWAQNQYPEYRVAATTINRALLNYENAVPMVTRCLQQFGFTVNQGPNGQLIFSAETTTLLKAHINEAKVEYANPGIWGIDLVRRNHEQTKKLEEALKEQALFREQLHQLSQSRRSPLPFLGGLLAGIVAGSAVATVIMTVS